MPKLKLKPEFDSLEVSCGNSYELKIAAGEVIDVSDDIYTALINLGNFEPAADEAIDDPLPKEPEYVEPED